jgi:CubicO group peptidase (beta-lactamase class C family)
MDTVKPEAVGFNAKRLQRIDDAMNRLVDQGKIAGVSTMLLRKGQIAHQKGYGMASIDLNRPMQSDTLFRIWSMTKTITTVAALMLYEQGYFQLDQDITDFIPEFKNTPVYVSGEGDAMVTEARKSPMTIRRLMTHSAGMAQTIGQHPVQRAMAELSERLFFGTPVLSDAVEELAKVPLIVHPGTEWHYGHGFELIARLVEIVTGQRYAAYLRENIFEPLGMKDTGYSVSEAQFDRLSAIYIPDEKRGIIEFESPAQNVEYRYREDIENGKTWTPGGNGLMSTPQDYARFAQMLLNKGLFEGTRILAPRTVDLMTANHLPAALMPYRFSGAQPLPGYGHGLSVHVLMDHGLAGVPCHNGEFWKDGGAGTLFWVDPTIDLVGICMYQLGDFWRVPVFSTFRNTVYQAIE